VNFENNLVIIESPSKQYLSVITKGQEFITNEGKIEFDNIDKLPIKILSSTGIEFTIYTPSYKDFVLLMKRGPQIIYPKDAGSIIVSANINSHSRVLEIGTGSGALTLFIATLLGPSSEFYSLDVSKKKSIQSR
jgi:tRNA (adenine57-N1/adenine58-N1)-methyltransferase